MNINEEIDRIWNEKIKVNLQNEENSIINQYSKEIDSKLDNFKNELCKNIDNIVKIAEKSILINKMNKRTENLIYQNNNNLINAVLLCLCNIKSFVFFNLGIEKEDILKKIKEIKNNSYFSLIVKLMNKLWIKTDEPNDEYKTKKFHDILKNDDPLTYNCKNPGKIIAFILSKLNDEFKLNQNINNINQNNKIESLDEFKKICKDNKNKINEEFFVNYQIKEKCINFDANKYYFEQRPIINLFIEPEVQLSVVGKGKFKDINLKESFNFLLNDNNMHVKKYCEICAIWHDFIINNFIQSLNNNILIINLDREKDTLLERNIIYPLYLELTYGENITKEYELISVLYQNENDYYNVYCKNLFNSKWIKYNEDEEIKKVMDENIVLNCEKVLLLIYKKKRLNI